MFSKKGSQLHTKVGWIYFWAMFGVFVTSSTMFFFKPERLLFLFLIGIFSFYQTFSGVRAIQFKHNNQLAGHIDWLVGVLVFLVSLVMLGMAVRCFFMDDNMGILYGVFGTICLLHSGEDLKRFRAIQQQNFHKDRHWFFHHIARMGGSYIATFTAFMVVNVHVVHPLVVWLAPGLVGGLLIARVTRRYRRRFGMVK